MIEKSRIQGKRTSQGCPFFFNFACSSRKVKSNPNVTALMDPATCSTQANHCTGWQVPKGKAHWHQDAMVQWSRCTRTPSCRQISAS